MLKKAMLISFAFLLKTSYALSLMLGISTEDLTRNSDAIVIGEVLEVSSYWCEKTGRIMSRALVLREDTIKGTAPSVVEIEYEGGEIGGLGLKVSDSPHFTKGEKVLIFIKEKDQALRTYEVFGKAQGKYTITGLGLAVKGGFTVVEGENKVDNYISLKELVNKIKGAP